MLRQSDGTRNRTRPSSRSGLTTITLPPRRRSATSWVMRRGWVVGRCAPPPNARAARAGASGTPLAAPAPRGAVRATRRAVEELDEAVVAFLLLPAPAPP